MALQGALDFERVPRLWPELARQIEAHSDLVVSLAEVERADSAALALLLEGLDLARRKGHRLRYQAIPEALLQLARMSHVDLLLQGDSIDR